MTDDLLPGEPEALDGPALSPSEVDPFRRRWPDTWETQPRMVDRTSFVVNVLADRLASRMVVVPDGEFAGIHVLTRKAAYEALTEDFPPTSHQSAEVITPARIYVTAFCPQCGIPAATTGYVVADLHVTDEAGEVKIKLKTKSVPHACGQLVLPTAPAPEGQTTVEGVISDTVTTDEQEEPVAGLEGALADVAGLGGLDDMELPDPPKPKRGRRK